MTDEDDVDLSGELPTLSQDITWCYRDNIACAGNQCYYWEPTSKGGCEHSQPTLSQDVLEAVPAWGVALQECCAEMRAGHAAARLEIIDLEARVANLEKFHKQWPIDYLQVCERVANLEAKQQTDRDMSIMHDKQLAKLEKALDWVVEYVEHEPEDTLEPIPWGDLD